MPTAPPAVQSGFYARVLPLAEWDRLRALPPFVALGGLPDPQATVQVVEDATGRIVASWIAVPFTHLEGVWVDPDLQHSRVPLLLLKATIATLQAAGVQVAFTLAPDADVQRLAEHAGFEPTPGVLMGLDLARQEG